METFFSENGCTIAVRTQKGSDVLDNRIIYSKLGRALENAAEEVMVNRITHFAIAMTQSKVVEGDPGFRWGSASDTSQQLAESFQGFCDITPSFIRKWLEALEMVEVAVLAPPDPT